VLKAIRRRIFAVVRWPMEFAQLEDALHRDLDLALADHSASRGPMWRPPIQAAPARQLREQLGVQATSQRFLNR
jgi:hypothetical protein